MAELADVARLAGTESGLCTVAVTRADGSVHASVVNAGVMTHPVTGADSVALVVRADAVKLGRVRTVGRASVTFRRGWEWAGVEGAAEVIDADPDAGPAGLAALLREVFVAAGGSHSDWDEYDRVMADEGRVAVFVAPERVLGRP